MPNNNQLAACPIYIPNSVTLNGIAIGVNGGASTGGVVRLGIYADDGTGVPGTLLVDAGTVDVTTNGTKSLTISLAVTPGIYWLAAVVQGNPTTRPTLWKISASGLPWPVSAGSAANSLQNALQTYAQNSVSGALGNWSAGIGTMGQDCAQIVVGVA